MQQYAAHDGRSASDANHDGRTVDRFKRSTPRPAASSAILIDFAAEMDAAEALAFARKNPHAVLATMKRDGTPQLSPVLVGVDSQDRLVVSTRESAMKTLNVRRDPRAWLCVLNDRFFGDWVQLGGDVEVVSLPTAMEPLVEYYRSISGGASGLGRLPRRHDQTAPLLDPGLADESRSEGHRLTVCRSGGSRNCVFQHEDSCHVARRIAERLDDYTRLLRPW
jgi:PPOX class probable F420-dependent enzyme